MGNHADFYKALWLVTYFGVMVLKPANASWEQLQEIWFKKSWWMNKARQVDAGVPTLYIVMKIEVSSSSVLFKGDSKF